MGKEQVLIYIDAKGVEHTALLVAKDQRHEGFVSLVYINGEVAQRLDSVAHESDPSKDEANPDLKRVALNCWKEADEVDGALVDRAAADYRAELQAYSEASEKHTADLEAYAKGFADLKAENDDLKVRLADVQEKLSAIEATTPPLAMGVGTSSTGELPAAGIFKVPTAADLDAYADEQKAKEAAIEAAAHPPTTETKHYADGSSATGPGPLPDHSPEGAPEVPAPTEAPTV